MQIDKDTYEAYFLLYIDGELDAGDRAAVEKFAEENPALKAELELLGQSVFEADENIVFERKEVLFREEKDRAAIILFGWRKIAVAAAVLIFLGAGGWLYLNKKEFVADHRKNEMAATWPAIKPSPQNKPAGQPAFRQPMIAKRTTESSRQNIRSKNGFAAARSAKNRIKEPAAVNDALAEDQAVPEARSLVQNTATVNDPGEKINIAVQARDIAAPEILPVKDNIRYADEDGASNDKVYFANTSFSKRNNLRIVFRKASRIIEKVTTLQ